jgi:hypothetical protein
VVYPVKTGSHISAGLLHHANNSERIAGKSLAAVGFMA